jgi:hypothetical protein
LADTIARASNAALALLLYKTENKEVIFAQKAGWDLRSYFMGKYLPRQILDCARNDTARIRGMFTVIHPLFDKKTEGVILSAIERSGGEGLV